jgi:hypothetical protein
MAISTADQQAVWAVPEADLSDNAKTTFQCMADHPDEVYATPGADLTISTQLGGSLSQSEANAALNELYQKGYLSIQGILPQYPAVVPSPT